MLLAACGSSRQVIVVGEETSLPPDVPTDPYLTPTASLPPTVTDTPTETLTPTITPTAPYSVGPTFTYVPTYTHTPPPSATVPPMVTSTPLPPATIAPTQNARACPPSGGAAACRISITIPTVAFQHALETTGGFPYPYLNFDRIGPVMPTEYNVLILENDSLRLTFLPALGGRLYQIHDKLTGQDILYNNPIITPSHWGPIQMRWWLLVGGIEWAFPAEEHGYAWGLPWNATTSNGSDGSASVTLSFQEQVNNLAVMVTVILPASGRSFTLNTSLANTGERQSEIQYWNNAMLRAGPGMRAELPTSSVIVHDASTLEDLRAGQTSAWEPRLSEWGRWQLFISLFGRDTQGNGVRMRGAGGVPGLLRLFNPDVTPGLKYFAFGPLSGVPAELNGEAYFEVWGGVSRNFDAGLLMSPGQRVEWSELWVVE